MPRAVGGSRFFGELRAADPGRGLFGDGSRFSFGRNDVFESPLVGEFNVRNAAMAAIAARFYGVTPKSFKPH